MDSYIAEFLKLMLVFSFAIISPGADLTMVIRQSIVHGRRNAIFTSFGIGTALLFHVSYTIFGLGLVISHSILLFNIIKWMGVAYLFYIGIKALGASGMTIAVAKDQQDLPQQKLGKAFALGFVVNALNPKAVFFFLTIFSLFVAPTTPLAVQFSYGVSMSIALIMWFIAVSLFMTTSVMRGLISKTSKWIDHISGLVFIAFGIRLMFQKAS